MADNSGGAEAGRQVPFNPPPSGSGLDGNDADAGNPVPAIDPNHAASERYIVRNVFSPSSGANDPFDRFDDSDRPSVPPTGGQPGVPQDISPPAPKMPINHGSVSLSDEEVVLS